MKRKRLYLVSLAVLVLCAAGFLTWWLGFRGSLGAVGYKVVVETDITPEGAGPAVLIRVVMHVPLTGGGPRAVKGYLRKPEGAADVYEFVTNEGHFLAVGRRFQGRLDALPPALKEVLAPWQSSSRIGRSGSYTIYRLE